MNRRDLLRAIGLSSLTLAAGSGLRPARSGVLALNGRLLRGTPGGEILESGDGGRSWRRAVFFGAGRPVLGLWLRGNAAQAQIGLAGRSFVLTSTDGRLWRTAGDGA